jgi:hypothetical protein
VEIQTQGRSMGTPHSHAPPPNKLLMKVQGIEQPHAFDVAEVWTAQQSFNRRQKRHLARRAVRGDLNIDELSVRELKPLVHATYNVVMHEAKVFCPLKDGFGAFREEFRKQGKECFWPVAPGLGSGQPNPHCAMAAIWYSYGSVSMDSSVAGEFVVILCLFP